MISILQMYLQAEQIDSADVELGVANTVSQEVDEARETVELQQIPGDQQVWLKSRSRLALSVG